jgi:4-diphosphocytidyl-2-C-methyl-D-erythritol kinase
MLYYLWFQHVQAVSVTCGRACTDLALFLFNAGSVKIITCAPLLRNTAYWPVKGRVLRCDMRPFALQFAAYCMFAGRRLIWWHKITNKYLHSGNLIINYQFYIWKINQTRNNGFKHRNMNTSYPCAKINLGLNIVSKRPDGYHDIETVFYPIGLCDRLEIEKRDDAALPYCRLNLNGMAIDGQVKDNLVVKAYSLLKESYPQIPNISASLTKNIPSQAGMGGGSSDCAFMIRMLNSEFNLGLSNGEMRTFAAKLGADCAFFITPSPAFATGIGERLETINLDLSRYAFGIVKPPVAVSTKEAFANVKPHKPSKCCKDIVMQPIETWKYELENDFEESIFMNHKEIGEIKQTLYRMGAVYAAMSGSGSAVFGIFNQVPEDFNSHFKNCFTAIV